MTDATETTKPTDAPPEPRPDQRPISYHPLLLTVFVRANGEITMQAHGADLATSITVRPEHREAFIAAVSTPYSGGTAQ